MGQIIVNNAATTISSSITNADGTVTLTDATNFPDPGSDYYLATLIYVNPASGREDNWEIVKVTGKTGSTLNITRAQEGTTAQSWDANTAFQVRITAGSLTFPDNAALTGGNIDGTVIGGTTPAAATFTTVDAPSVQLTGGTATQGTLSWNTDEETLDLDLDGPVLQLGQEVHIHVRNNTGSQITNGTPVMLTGTVGASGRLTIAAMDGTDVDNEYKFLGFTTEDISDGTDGKVTHFGKVRGVNTSGFSDGDILWISTTAIGGLTTTEPSSGLKLPVAIVINSAANGTLFVRHETSVGLHDLHEVVITTPADGEILQYNSGSSLWENQTLTEAGFADVATSGAYGDLSGTPTAVSTFTNDSGYLTGNETITFSGDATGSGTTAVTLTLAANSVAANEIAANAVSASELNVSGNGTTSQFLRADGDGSFTWATPTNTTYSAGTGLALSSTTFSLDFSELTDKTTDIAGTTEFIIQDGTTESRKAASEIKLSNFNNDLNWTANTGDITNVSAGVGLSGGGASGSVSLALNFAELTDMTADIIGTTEFILQNGAVESRKAASEIKLSNFNNDSNWNNYTHPTYNGDDFSVDTGALTGATVVSDIDINVTTDTLGHVTDANGVISTRNLTYGDVGAVGQGADIPASVDLNNYTTTGWYHQNSNANASSGTNYPSAQAGLLEVFKDGSMVYQRYTLYNSGARFTRSKYISTWYPWLVEVNSSNYTTYAPTKTGTGASGTWGINITGNAGTATSATSATSSSTITMFDFRTDSAAYPVLWGTETATTSIYSCTDVRIKSSTAEVQANRFLINNGGTFFSDASGRIATTADFYVQATSNNTFLYSTNTYLGNTSGDSIFCRGNTISGTSWSITGAGDFTGVSFSGNAATATQASGAIPVQSTGVDDRDKIRVWSGGTYGFGMESAVTFGFLNDFAITTQMSNTTNRGFWWGDSGHAKSGGAMSLTTTGQLYVATRISVGEGQSETSPLATYTLNVTGDIGATSNITAYASDKRLKENIEPIENALSKVQKLRGVTFDWKDSCEDIGFTPEFKTETGVIAQEVQEVIPDAVKTAPFNERAIKLTGVDENYLTVDKEKLIPLLIEAVKEQQRQIDELKEMLRGNTV